jgi:hypothetical protein
MTNVPVRSHTLLPAPTSAIVPPSRCPSRPIRRQPFREADPADHRLERAAATLLCAGEGISGRTYWLADCGRSREIATAQHVVDGRTLVEREVYGVAAVKLRMRNFWLLRGQDV